MQAPSGTQRSAIPLALALSLPDHLPVRIVHRLPHRVRLRPQAGCWTPAQAVRVAAALRRADGIQSFRVARHSLVIHHSAPLQAVLDSVRLAMTGSLDRERHVPRPAAREAAPARLDATAARQRAARRRMLLCAAATLALALLPEPAAPAPILLRLVAIALTAAARRHAQRQAPPDLLTRVLDALAAFAGIVRAERLAMALLKQCAETLFERWLEPRQRRFAPA